MQRSTAAAWCVAVLVLAATLLVVGPGTTQGPAAITVPHLPVENPLVPSPDGPVEVAPAYAIGQGVSQLGTVPPSTLMDVAVGLAVANEPGLSALVDALYVPGTSVYHHFLSTSELAARFGASPTAITTAERYFESFGLAVTVSPDHLLLSVTGSAGRMGPAFGTAFDLYRRADGTTLVSHPTPAILPSVAPWTGVLGLGNATPLRPAVVGPEGESALVSPDSSCGSSTYIDPCQVWGAYNMSPTTPSTDGAGETIGVVDTYDSLQTENDLKTDLQDFDADESLPAPNVNFLYPVGPTNALNSTVTDWGVEESLDLEWSHSSAPGATIDMTFSPNPNVGLYQAVDYLVAHQSVNVISMSWGEPDVGVENAYAGPCSLACNASTDGSYALLGPVLEFAAAEGISVFAASGDCGAANGTNGVATNFPASDPYVTGVGGTYLMVSSTGTWEDESGWSGNATGATSPGCQNQGGSGGGYSPFPRPWWQSGPGVPISPSGRGVPDVSAIAAPSVVIVYSGIQYPVGGTSLATPLWAGVAALADENAGQPLGFLDPTLYTLLRNATEYANDFHDIATGNNGYLAGRGWDPVTGIGTPIVANLLSDLAAPPPVLSSLVATLNVSATSGTTPLNVSFTVGASGGAGTYPVEGVYFGDGNASYVTGGVISHVYSSPGVYSAQAYVVDSAGNFSTSLPIAIVVGGGSALGVNLTVDNSAPNADAPVTFSTTATGGIGPYQYLYYFGDGTYQNWSSDASVVHSYGTNGSFCATALVRDSATPVDGGIGLPVSIGVGSAPRPTCASSPVPLNVTGNSTVAVRDAPADFPNLFQIRGGAGTISEQLRANDPYVAACECEILRSPGNETFRLYVNESVGAPGFAEANVTVAAPLNATFTASPTFGAAPLTVNFTVSATGGYEANASLSEWTFGNGNSSTGAKASETYTTPGFYWAVGHLSDRGDGNASRAFLIDVRAAGPSAAPYLNATIAPVIDVASGATVEYAAQALAWNATRIGGNYTWEANDGVAAYAADANRTYNSPASAPGAVVDQGNVSVTFSTTGANETVPFDFPNFFAVESGGFVPRVDALTLADTGGPWKGPGPLYWLGAANALGPGGVATEWTFGDGTMIAGPGPAHAYWTAGLYSLLVRTTDTWGDVAVDAHGVDVTSTGVPLSLIASPSVEVGAEPLAVTFTALASGGSGAPYSYHWQFGDGAVASAANVTHTYTRVGTFVANITVTDSHGTSFSRTYDIVVTSAPSSGLVLGFIPRSISLALLAVIGGLATGLILAVGFGRSRGRPSP